jgi:hypothetical protein
MCHHPASEQQVLADVPCQIESAELVVAAIGPVLEAELQEENRGSSMSSAAGTATTVVPADFAARMPASESSNAMHWRGRTPSRAITVR